MLRRLRSVLAALLGRGRFERAMDEELGFHVEAFAADLVRAGVPREDAERRARLEFGAVESIKEECRRNRGLRLLDEAGQDLRYALRLAVKTPVVTATAILSIALGIGANTAIFTLIDAVLLRAVPIAGADRVFFLAHEPGPSTSANYPLFERYRASPAFSGVTAYRGQRFRVTTPDGIEQVSGQYVSGNYHAILGTGMRLGRGFASDADRGAASLSAVVSYDYWMARFGGSDSVLSRTLTVDDRVLAIVGVTPEGFHGLSPGSRVDITLPMSVMALGAPGFFDAYDGWTSLSLIARLAPGVSRDQAVAAVDAMFQQFLEEPPNRWVRRAGRGQFRSGTLVAAGRGTSGLRRTYGTPLWVLMGMVALVLLVACVNVANLLLARAAARAREVAIRLSIGAARQRLIRQFLIESLVLGLVGGAIGVAVAWWGSGAILGLLRLGPSPLDLAADLNLRVLAFTTALSVLTGLAFGLAPALRGTRVDAAATLKASASVARGGYRGRAGSVLTAAQIAFCVVLLAGAGLLMRSLVNLETFDAGFTRSNLVLADLDAGEHALSPDDRARFYADLLDRLRARGIADALSLSTRTPIDFSLQVRRITVPGFQSAPGDGVSTNVVTDDYFRTFAIELLRGRLFGPDDHQTAPRVAIVSEGMARFYFAGRDPIGQTFTLGGNKAETTIVGVVEDTRHELLRQEAAPRMVYTPLRQTNANLEGRREVPANVAIAAQVKDAAAAVSAIREETRALSRNVIVSYARTMEQQIDAALIPERLLATLSAAFAAVALLLACIGLYGTMSYAVERRAREIGIRMALGAIPRTMRVRILAETLTVALAGIVAGLLLAVAAGRTVSSYLFGLSPYDPWTLGGTALALLGVAAAAGFLPARHAATVDPVLVLKAD